MQCEETILKINTDEDDSWVNEKVVIDFPVPKDIRYVMEECERLAEAEDVSYFNWADKLAPIFDNGASFSNKVPDDRLKRYLQDTEKIKNSSLNTTTTFEYKGKPLTVRKMFELENPDFQEAVLRNVPRIIEKFTEICAFIDSIPVEYNGIIVCAPERAAFYKKSMECRLEHIFIPCYEKLKFSL